MKKKRSKPNHRPRLKSKTKRTHTPTITVADIAPDEPVSAETVAELEAEPPEIEDAEPQEEGEDETPF